MLRMRFLTICTSSDKIIYAYYSRTLMARTSLGPWKFVRDIGSSSHLGLIMAQGQEANGDKLSCFFFFVVVVFFRSSIQ